MPYTTEELAQRFDDLVAALERIADLLAIIVDRHFGTTL
jgi:hypothetical protein